MKRGLKMLLNRLVPERKKSRSGCGDPIRFSHRLTGDEPLKYGTMVQRFDSVSCLSRPAPFACFVCHSGFAP